MKKVIYILLAMTLLIGIIPASVALADNGAPNAPKLFQLNIIGVPKDKTADMDNNNGHRIFVKLDGVSKIYLIEAMEDGEPMAVDDPDAFQVLDANGTDGRAELQLPNPGLDPYIIGDPQGDTVADYSIYIRPLGKPGGYADITTVADLKSSTFGDLLPGGYNRLLNKMGEEAAALAYASVEQVPQEYSWRHPGQEKFENVTAELLTIVFRVEIEVSEGVYEEIYIRVPIFDEMLENEHWYYDNHGLKNLQVRFYHETYDVTQNDGPFLPD
jgi:hypothetical protein